MELLCLLFSILIDWNANSFTFQLQWHCWWFNYVKMKQIVLVNLNLVIKAIDVLWHMHGTMWNHPKYKFAWIRRILQATMYDIIGIAVMSHQQALNANFNLFIITRRFSVFGYQPHMRSSSRWFMIWGVFGLFGVGKSVFVDCLGVD